MRRLISSALIALAAAAAPDAWAAAAKPPPSPTERGKALAQEHCAACHTLEAKGASPLAEAPPFRDLNERVTIANLAEALAEGIMVGHPAMPQFAFQPDEVEALLAFLESIQAKPKN